MGNNVEIILKEKYTLVTLTGSSAGFNTLRINVNSPTLNFMSGTPLEKRILTGLKSLFQNSYITKVPFLTFFKL